MASATAIVRTVSSVKAETVKSKFSCLMGKLSYGEPIMSPAMAPIKASSR